MRQKSFGEQQSDPTVLLSCRFKVLDDVAFFWINSDCQVRRQCPRRSGPDGDARLLSEFTAYDREPNVNCGVIALLVFHFCFCQRGLRASAPKDRLLGLVNQAFFHENGECTQNLWSAFG